MKRIILGLIITSCLCLACSKSNPVVGTWQMDMPREQVQAAKNMGVDVPKVTMVFNSDNTFDASVTGGSQSKKAHGKYELKDKELTLTATEVDGKPASADDSKPQKVTLSDDMKSFTQMGMTFRKQ